MTPENTGRGGSFQTDHVDQYAAGDPVLAGRLAQRFLEAALPLEPIDPVSFVLACAIVARFRVELEADGRGPRRLSLADRRALLRLLSRLEGPDHG